MDSNGVQLSTRNSTNAPDPEVSRGLPHPRINGLNAEARQGPGSSSGWGQGLCATSVSARACHEPRRQGSSPTLAKLG